MLDLGNTLGGLLLQPSLYVSSGNVGVQKHDAYTLNDQLVGNLYFNDNNGYNKNNNTNNNNTSNDNDNNGNKGIGSALLNQNQGMLDNQILNASFDLGSQQFVDSQWSLEEFLLGSGASNGLTNQIQHPQQTYVQDLSSTGSSPYSSNPQSPQTPLSPPSPQGLQNLQSPQPVLSPAASTNSSLDDLLDDLELVSPYGSPPNAEGFLAGASPASPSGSFVGSPYGSSVSSPASSGSLHGFGSPYGSPGSSVAAVDSLEEILNGLTAPMEEQPAEEMEFQVNNQLPMEVTTSEVVEESYPILTAASLQNAITGNMISGNYSLVDLLTNNCGTVSTPLLGSGIPTTVQSVPSSSTVDISLLQPLQSSQPIKAEANIVTNQAQNHLADPVIPSPIASPNPALNFNQSPTPLSPLSPAASPASPAASPASSDFPAAGTGGKEERRYAPYKNKSKPRTEAQKERKKEHNRKSASKYRSKKKQELEVKTTELDELEEKNMKLKGTVEDLRKEIDYLKTLMLDVIKARMEKKKKEEKKVTSPSDVDISVLLAALAK